MKFAGIITESMRNNFSVLELNRSTDGTIIEIFVSTHLIFTQIMSVKSQNNFILQIYHQSSMIDKFLSQNYAS